MAGHRDVNFLVDTGSEVTLMSHALARDLGISQVGGTKFVLSSFTQDQIKTIGEIKVALSVAGVQAQHRCIIVDSNMECDILLGMDFINTHQLNINAKKKVVSSDWGTSKFLSSEPTPVVNRIKVRTDETTTVPPNSIMFVKGFLEDQRIADKSKVLNGHFEPYGAVNGLFTAEAICYSEDRKIPVRVLNTTDEPIILYERKLLGFLDPPMQETREMKGVKVVQRIVANGNKQHTDNKTHQSSADSWTEERLFRELRVDQLEISSEEKIRLKGIIWKYRDVFSKHEFDLGTCNFFKARINLRRDAEPQYVTPIQTPYKQQEALQDHLDGLIGAGVVEEASRSNHGLWNSRVFLIAKPHQPGKFRFVADFRALNSQCLPDTYMLPNINTVTDKMAGAKLFSTFDLSKSFYQVDYDAKSVGLTAFTANGKRYVFRKMVMGHLSSSSQFARMIDGLLETIPMDQLAYFLDDLMLASMDVTSHLDRLETLLTKLATANLKLMPAKCELLKKKVEFVGLTISEEGVSVNDQRVEAVKEIPPPRTLKECQKVMGFLNYNHKFVKGFSGLAKPIYQLIDKKRKFNWTKECQEVFEEIKRRIAEGIKLAIPRVEDPDNSYVVTIDASEHGFGAELAQWQDEELRTVAYFSKRVPNHKRKWSQHKLEFECLVETLLHFSIYLKGTKFLVKTDCLSLLSLEKMFLKDNATMVRRLNKIADFSFKLQHIEGIANETVDFISRHLYKRRTQEMSTQTDNTKVRDPNQLGKVLQIGVSLQSKRQETGTPAHQSEQSTEDVLISEEMLTADWTSNNDSGTPDLNQVTAQQPCVCDSDLLDQQEQDTAHVRRIEFSSLTEQLDIGELLDKQKIASEQNRDPVLMEVRKWLSEGKPTKLQRLRLPTDMLTYWKHLNLITETEGVLCKKWIKHNKETKEIEIQRFLVLVPESLKVTVLDQHHSSLLAMHPGIDNTCELIRQRYYWPRMREEVELYVKSCITCGGCKQPHHYLKAPLRHVITYEPMDTIAIDHIVPTKEGATKRGYRLILSITDVFSGYVLALPCKTKRSEETIRLILHKWCLRFGYPSEILADNDTSFSSEFFNEVCSYFKTKVTHGVPYKCSSTSKAENSNKRINKALRVTLSDKQILDWDLYLNFVAFALNGIRSRHTGFSANQIVFGKHLNTPLDLELDGSPILLDNHATKKKTTAYVIYRTIRDIVRKARRHAALDFGYADSAYNKKMLGPYFKQGDWVFTLMECPKHKFEKRWQGPFQITKKIDDHLYIIDLGSRDKLVNISKLKPYTKSKYSPPHLNVNAPLFSPKSVDSSNVVPDNRKDSENDEERQGVEIEFDCTGHKFSPSTTEVAETNQHEQGIPDTVVNTTTPPEHVAEDDGWQLVQPEISPPIDPVDAPSMPNRRNPVRERRPTNFLNISGFTRRSKSYN